MIELLVGDTVSVNGHHYFLEEKLSGGYQFYTWRVKESKRRKDEAVVKLTDIWTRFTREIGAYKILENKPEVLPRRYFSKLLAFDHNAPVIREGSEIGRLSAILLKKYPYTLREFLKAHPGIRDLKTVRGKLRKRVSALHEQNFAHKDLHAGNILIRKTGVGVGVVLTDFALSRFGDEEAKAKDRRDLDKLVRRLSIKIDKIEHATSSGGLLTARNSN